MKKKEKMRVKIISVPLYKTKVYFCITKDQEEAKKYFKKNYINVKNWPERAEALTWTKDGCYIFCYLPEIKTGKGLSVLCHEIVHVAWQIIGDCNVEITRENHEALTYVISYLTKELLK